MTDETSRHSPLTQKIVRFRRKHASWLCRHTPTLDGSYVHIQTDRSPVDSLLSPGARSPTAFSSPFWTVPQGFASRSSGYYYKRLGAHRRSFIQYSLWGVTLAVRSHLSLAFEYGGIAWPSRNSLSRLKLGTLAGSPTKRRLSFQSVARRAIGLSLADAPVVRGVFSLEKRSPHWLEETAPDFLYKVFEVA